jgi:hypothetical protein
MIFLRHVVGRHNYILPHSSSHNPVFKRRTEHPQLTTDILIISRLLRYDTIKIPMAESCPTTRHEGAWEERRYSSYSFSTSALDGVSGQRHDPGALYPEERAPGTHCTGGWVGPRAGLDAEVRGKILSPLPGIEP